MEDHRKKYESASSHFENDELADLSGPSHERWLVSYADFMTLLMGFFVVMYSLSQVSDDHFRVLGEALNQAFNADQLEDPTINDGVPQLSYTSTPIDLEGNALEDRRGNDSSVVPETMISLEETKEQHFESLTEDEPTLIAGNERWLQVEFSSELLFESGGAKLAPEIQDYLSGVVTELLTHNKAIRVEGFTDNKPVSGGAYPSNWELSSARAAAVVRYLVDQGVDAHRLSAVGYGEFYPIATNSTEEGRKENRRIVLSISAHEGVRPIYPQEVQRAKKRIYPYELRAELPEGVDVHGLETKPREEASQWLRAQLGQNNSSANQVSAESEVEQSIVEGELSNDSSIENNNNASL